MGDRLYTYNNTFTDSNFKENMKSPQDTNFEDVENVSDCELQAIINSSPFFALTDFNNVTGEAKCLLPKTNKSITESATLINGANKCLEYVGDGCFFTNNGDNFGIGNNFSLYTSPRLTINMLENDSANIISKESITQHLDEIRNILSQFLDDRRRYLEFYFLNVQIDGDADVNGGERFFSTNARDEFLTLKTNMEDSQTLLENRMDSLNNNFNNLLKTTQGFNENFRILNTLIEILNSKIIMAEKFFNVLMSKNQGAIGELDLTEYNRNLSIFENVVLSIIMSTALYLYFKK